MRLVSGTDGWGIPLTCVLLILHVGLVVGPIHFTTDPHTYFSLPENSTWGTYMFSLKLESTESDNNLLITTLNDNALVTIADSGSNYVVVNATLNVELDYDKGQRQLQCIFQGSNSDPIFIQYWRGAVGVVDVNDETPMLKNQPYSVTVLENTTSNYVIYRMIHADDADEGDVIIYTITASGQTTDTDKFSIDEHSGLLILKQKLDFEDTRFYQYNVTATDQVGHTDSADIFITVGDVQDTPPYFTGEPYLKSIPENTAVSSSLLQIRATDGDRGVSNKVSLNITSETCPGLFEINSITGDITLKNVADRDNGTVYNNTGTCTLEIKATEDDTYPQSPDSNSTATTSVTITIEDVDDNPPTFSRPSYNVTVEENTQNGVPINFNTHISVTDIDQRNNAVFEVNIIELQDYFDVAQPQIQSTGDVLIRVKNSSILDYEKNTSLIIKLEAKEMFGNLGRNTATVTVEILNVNDHSPVFSISTNEADVQENSLPGTSIKTIQATDADENDDIHNYGKLTYSLMESNSNFIINSSTGLITVGNATLDRESQDIYFVTLVAEDGGHSKASVQVQIRIIDVNDQPPTFVTNDYQTSLKESESRFSQPITVHATDRDAPSSPNSEIIYSIASTVPLGLESHFRVHPDTGSLSVSSALDYENIAHLPEFEGNITITVLATDKGNPTLNSSVSVTVLPQDVNDNPPSCDQPLYTISVPENASTSIHIFDVKAADNDSTQPNNLIMYSIDQASAGKFIINSSTGSISLRDKLDREQTDYYNITVTVTDFGMPSLSGSCLVFVNVSDINDTPPKFSQNSWEISFKENTKGLSLQIKATDSDLNNKLVYEIVWKDCTATGPSGQIANVSILENWITIDPYIGIITNSEEMDREVIEHFTLALRVQDNNTEENGPQIDNAKLTVVIEDENDNAPSFNGSHFSATIQENMPEGTEIKLDLVINDLDVGNNSQYNIILENSDGFTISPLNGEGKTSCIITVANSSILDYELHQSITLKVLATDQRNSSMYNSATIFMNITNENDNIPEFSGTPYKVPIPERSLPGTVVTTVQATDKDKGDYGQLTYSLEDNSNKFRINTTTGEVTFYQGTLDFEDFSVYTMTLFATDGGNFRATTQLTITVSDVNDETPIFASESYNLTIDENSKVIFPTVSVQATDNDEANTVNSAIEYLLLNASSSLESHFRVDPQTGVFSIETPLDCEALNCSSNWTFFLTVVAQDNGTVKLSNTTSVKVTVCDINDNSPTFLHDNNTVDLSEDTLVGSSVIDVNATDKDVSPENNIISYMLDTFSANTFDIVRATGHITLKRKLDREQISNYTIIVTALDSGQPTETSTTLVFVNVDDVNDSPPTFLWDTLSETVIENNKRIITVNKATDPDEDPNLYYSIVWSESSGLDGSGRYLSGDSLKKFVTIDNTTGAVHPVNKLDRERVQRFQLTLLVEDKNNKPGTKNNDTALLTVIITDENDNPPEFNGDHFNATIQENMPAGSEIKLTNGSVLIINDPDVGDNSRFNITLEDSSVFNIFPVTGDGSTPCVITVVNSSVLDYEQRENITIKVIATEYLTLKNTSATVTIFIQNINDNFPKFNKSLFEVSVSEDSHSGKHITSLQASDADRDEWGIVYYSFDETQTWFLIDNITGDVTLNMKELDRENKSSYSVTVKARDKGNFEGSTQLTIKVTDYNDKEPTFQKLSYAADIKENSKSFEVPLFVKATDDDDPTTDNTKISYFITEIPKNVQNSSFTIDNTTGEITVLNKAPDYESLNKKFPRGIFQIEVTAKDWGIPSLNSSILINVTVLDVNDETPQFTHPSYTGSVKENSIAGISVAMVKAIDRDGKSPNNEFHYVIESGSRDKLQINSTSGLISVEVGARLDRETTEKDGFNLTVIAIDHGSPSNTGTTTVSVNVFDVNDSPPEITPTNAEYSVPENITLRSVIAQFNATDQDEFPHLVFTLLELRAYSEKGKVNTSLIKDWLDVDNITGDIAVNSEMDREKVEQIILKVVVSDMNSTNGIQQSTATVTVNLLDVNDNPPKISSGASVLHLNVSEGTKLDTEVTTLTATDADKAQTVKFSISNANTNFSITQQGKLTLISKLDREDKPQLEFDVIATDSGSPPLSSNITVVIDVLDINDNDPEFSGNQTTFSVLENADNTTVVAQMTATDADDGDNSFVTFDFKDTSLPFRIDQKNGTIYVNGSIDRETTSSYSLTVIASDNPVMESKRRALRTINIVVLDLNDNSPVFSSAVYNGVVSEMAAMASTLTIEPIISATDKDDKNNSVITFSILPSSADYFTIDSYGTVRVNYNLTDKTGNYSYLVNASDQGFPVQWQLANLTIIVLDANNNAPVFVTINKTLTIPECAGHGKSVYTFHATDADVDKSTNGKVQYFLDANTGNNHSQFFQIDKDTGVLTTTSNNNIPNLFDSETLSELVIYVIATDCGIPENQHTSSGPIHIIVTDVNDNPPKFDSGPNMTFSVKEGNSGIKVGHVMATDKDLDSELCYAFLDVGDPWMDYFYITDDPVDGGVIYVNKSLDREVVGQIKMKVTATDMANNKNVMCDGQYFDRKSATIGVIVIIEDINDSPPIFQEKSLLLGFLSSTKYGEKFFNLLGHVKDDDTAPNSVHTFYQIGETQADSNILNAWSEEAQPYPIMLDINGTLSTNYMFSEVAYGYFTLRVLVNDSAGNDTITLKIYIVGESQVVHMTMWYTEDQLRQLQNDLTRELSSEDYTFIADNIQPATADDGSVDNSKSVLIVHAIDKNGNIVSGRTLRSILDKAEFADALGRYRVLKTVAGDETSKLADDSTDRNLYILIGIITVIVVAFIITLTLLVYTIQRFKRKLKAATLDIHDTNPVKEDIFPGLDNENIKSANPIFMRDDLIVDVNKLDLDFDHSNKDDTLSNLSENSLDQNAINSTREVVKSADEQEVTLDVYEHDEVGTGMSHIHQHLQLRHSQFLLQDEHSPTDVVRQTSFHVNDNEEDDENLNMSFSNFECTDI